MRNLKISFNVRPKAGPWGGGNLFIENLKDFLESNGHQVVFNLFDSDIDIILVVDPRLLSESVLFTMKEIEFYKKYINNNCKVVHRINECDERKNTTGLNEYYLKANLVADYTVFVSEWIRNLYINFGFSRENYSVIMSGSNNLIFNNMYRAKWRKDEPLRIVTHHWGDNLNKGFDIYEYLDEQIYKHYQDKLIFTYIGNVNKNIIFKNTNVIEPKAGNELSRLIKENHIYLTASINEPSGNHHIEAAQCGLPILYRNSGGVPEFTKGFGISFDGIEDFIESLDEIKSKYNYFFDKLSTYPYNSNLMCKDYLDLFFELNKSSNKKSKTSQETNKSMYYLSKFIYKFNKFLNSINIYEIKVRIKKYLLIKFPILKNERNVV